MVGRLVRSHTPLLLVGSLDSTYKTKNETVTECPMGFVQGSGGARVKEVNMMIPSPVLPEFRVVKIRDFSLRTTTHQKKTGL